jgi:hypothetical protein
MIFYKDSLLKTSLTWRQYMNKMMVLVFIIITLFSITLLASENMQMSGKKALSIPTSAMGKVENTRDIPSYMISLNPTPLINSYFDYLIGGYYNLPMQVQPTAFGNDIYLTYHAKPFLAEERHAYYTKINGNTNAVDFNERITNQENYEGYSTLVIDPQTGKNLLAWHERSTSGTVFDIKMTWDPFLEGNPGFLFDPMMVIDNPISITCGATTTTDNDFMWPQAIIGPSPNAGYKRLYVASRNTIAHNGYLSQNTYIAYADYTTQMVDNGTPLTWTYISIPMQNEWNLDNTHFRFPYYNFIAGDDGKIYCLGYHDPNTTTGYFLDEDALDCFINDNYGEGTWRHVSANAFMPAWNPPLNDGTGHHFFHNANQIDYPDSSMFWYFGNNEKSNAVYDPIHHKIHYPALYALCVNEDTYTNYLNNMQYVRQIEFDTETETFSSQQVYPQGVNTTGPYVPWDKDDDHLVDLYNTDGTPFVRTIWPFCQWDDTEMYNSMMISFTNVKITEPNEHGQMAMVWQDSWKARMYRLDPDHHADLSSYVDAPEIFIALSDDYGASWYEPVVLNAIDNPELAGMIPQFVYPANKLVYLNGENNGTRLYLLFFDDNSWGSYVQQPPVGNNDGGTVMYMAVDLIPPVGNDDHIQSPSIATLKQNYPNPFNPNTKIIFYLSRSDKVDLTVYNVRGQVVKTLLNENVKQGEHSIDWNGTDGSGNLLSSGVYFYKLSNGKFEQTRKMLLLK